MAEAVTATHAAQRDRRAARGRDGRHGARARQVRRPGARRPRRAEGREGAMDLVRRQLARSHAAVAADGRSSERQGDRVVDGSCAARGEPWWRMASCSARSRSAARRGSHGDEVAREPADPAILMVIAAGPLVRYDLARARLPLRRPGTVRAPDRVRDAGERELAARARSRRRARSCALRGARRSVPVREARAPPVEHAIRRDGERERDLLRRQAVPQRSR